MWAEAADLDPWSCHTYPNDRLLQLEKNYELTDEVGCHTYPNDKLLQPARLWILSFRWVVIPIQTISFYNGCSSSRGARQVVVIPIQTISFYNCDLYDIPEDLEVVIPIQTIGFYNMITASAVGLIGSCHTYPNDRLLQHSWW